ncbi:hypothetical protein TA3x_003520 [Tundrisphaera sp. TA3]|uniref:hypothetical protein n=1 Tax=Tundrisphaera sp. TA3 TaxID=3435775 RepID=UPI003EB89E7F
MGLGLFLAGLPWTTAIAIAVALVAGILGAWFDRLAARRDPSRASGVFTFFSSISWIVLIMALSVVSVVLFWLFVLLCAHLRGTAPS